MFIIIGDNVESGSKGTFIKLNEIYNEKTKQYEQRTRYEKKKRERQIDRKNKDDRETGHIVINSKCMKGGI